MGKAPRLVLFSPARCCWCRVVVEEVGSHGRDAPALVCLFTCQWTSGHLLCVFVHPGFCNRAPPIPWGFRQQTSIPFRLGWKHESKCRPTSFLVGPPPCHALWWLLLCTLGSSHLIGLNPIVGAPLCVTSLNPHHPPIGPTSTHTTALGIRASQWVRGQRCSICSSNSACLCEVRGGVVSGCPELCAVNSPLPPAAQGNRVGSPCPTLSLSGSRETRPACPEEEVSGPCRPISASGADLGWRCAFVPAGAPWPAPSNWILMKRMGCGSSSPPWPAPRPCN